MAGVSLNVLFGDRGIIKRAQDAQNKWNNAEKSDINSMNNLDKLVDEQINSKKILITDSSLKSDNRVTNPSATVIAKDIKENQVVVPGGFKISDDSGESVQQGIVIEDKDGNQFVWVPVSNIDGSNKNPITIDNNSTKTITLGRYDNFTIQNDILPSPYQTGINYREQNVILNQYQELYEYRETEATEYGTNTTAKNLKGFVESVAKNSGFYIARYEASYGKGYDTSSDNPYNKAIPLSIKTDKYSEEKMNYEKGTLWNFIGEQYASIVSRNMYSENKYVESDLINSYAWDTTMIYIQACSDDSNYATKDYTNKTLKNTGDSSDYKCKIYDMGGNLQEWTTEFSNEYMHGRYFAGVKRGGSEGAYKRNGDVSINAQSSFGFRTIIYIK